MKYRGHGHHHHHEPTEDALEFRSIDGNANNLTQGDLNSAGTHFARVAAANPAYGFVIPRDDGRFRAPINKLQLSSPAA
jgi:hypothetical protein